MDFISYYIHSMKNSIKRKKLHLLLDNDPSLIHMVLILTDWVPYNQCAISLTTSLFKLGREVKVMTSALIMFLLIFLVFDNEKVAISKKKKKCPKRVAKISEYFFSSGFILSVENTWVIWMWLIYNDFFFPVM